ncbi:hypothetical protein LLW22_04170 [Enterococcus casseliflavus]|nr:hypothetical protein LLW22_04170 [Enterococcus casseliflavus]
MIFIENQHQAGYSYDIVGGLIITIAGITFVGWKAAALISAGLTTLSGAATLGFWNRYNDTKKK